jgi:hypothetical protein
MFSPLSKLISALRTTPLLKQNFSPLRNSPNVRSITSNLYRKFRGEDGPGVDRYFCPSYFYFSTIPIEVSLSPARFDGDGSGPFKKDCKIVCKYVLADCDSPVSLA